MSLGDGGSGAAQASVNTSRSRRRSDGEVDCPGYLDDDASRALLASLPLEHLVFEAERASPDRLIPRLINRLRRERLQFEGRAGPVAALLLLPGAGAAGAGKVWSLQSYPWTAIGEAKAGAAAIRELAGRAGHVFFARRADMIHPSAASIVARMGGPDAVCWNRFSADGLGAGTAGVVMRRPPFDPVSARHGAMTDTSLAVKGEILTRCPDDVLTALSEGRLHPLWFWLAGQGLGWASHPEALTSDVGESLRLGGDDVRLDEAIYRRIIDAEGGDFALHGPFEDLPFPYVLTPRRRAGKTSVIVCFRDGADLTLRCIRSLSTQRLTGEMQLILVDNQSSAGVAQTTLEVAQELLGKERVTLLSYDRPFNHSAQNNLGARAALGEVLVICNNDVVLNEPDLLEQLAAWALQPGVATVGCRLENPERGVGAYGHIAQAPSADPFRPALRENPDPTYGRHLHASAGSTLALAAVARDRFQTLGGLDETRFPIGYNDADFMLRCSAAGLVHLHLGHLSAEHNRGASRTGDDESLQALWINQAHRPDVLAYVRQFSRERIGDETGGVQPRYGSPPSLVEAPGPRSRPPAPWRRFLLAIARARRRVWGRQGARAMGVTGWLAPANRDRVGSRDESGEA